MPAVMSVLAKLLRSCALLWLLGLAGMWFTRAVLVLDPNAPLFRLAAGLWILGGLGYTGFGVFGLVTCARTQAVPRGATPADVSAWIRRG
jgi:hypothetical protein